MGKNVNGLVAVLLAIVVGVAMLPTVTDSVESYDITTTTESFTAEEDDATEETFTVEEDIEELNFVEVEGEELSEDDYSYSGKDVDLVDDASDTDDEVNISYDYQIETSGAVDSLVDLLPILFAVIMVAGAVQYVRFKQ